MSKNRSVDGKGLVVEMLQDGSEGFLYNIGSQLSDALKRDMEPPAEWHRSRIIVFAQERLAFAK